MKLSKQIFLAFFVVLLLSAIDSIANYLLSMRVKENSEFLNKSEAIIRNSSRLHKSIIDMQSAFRGYLLTNDSAFRNEYREGILYIPSLFKEQEKLIDRKSTQGILLDSINQLHQQWINYADSLVSVRGMLSVSIASRLTYDRLFENKLRKKIGKNLNDEISRKFMRFDKTEYRLRNIRDQKLLESIRTTHVYSLIFLSLTVLIGICSMIYIVRLITKRIASMVILAENISRGNFTVVNDESNDELTGLSTSLNIMSGKLSKSIHELEKQNTELNRFAYVVSHDLKAPLRGIHNVIHWIEEDFGKELSPELRKFLSIIPQRTQRMENLINGLLDYARTREKTSPEYVDTRAMAEEICNALLPRTYQLKLGNLPEIYTERIKLEQVFTNLISNAAKYTKREDGIIEIRCREIPGFYEFSIRDNGIGIAPEHHAKIFEIFQTLREKDEAESTGIGLAITKKIIDDQHCTIRLSSDTGNGAEFIFTWPAPQKEQI